MEPGSLIVEWQRHIAGLASANGEDSLFAIYRLAKVQHTAILWAAHERH
jgi:hypothetical protein